MTIKLLDLLFEDKIQDTTDDDVTQSKDIEPDPIVQMLINASKENQGLLENVSLYEMLTKKSATRIKSGSDAQQKVLSFLRDSDKFKKFIQSSDTNVPGSQGNDITLYNFQNKDPIIMEVKSVSNFDNSIYFFDKSIGPLRSNVKPSFFNLIRMIAIKRLGLSPDWPEKAKPSSEGVVKSYDLIKHLSQQKPIKQQTTKEEIKNCIEFASLPEKIRNMIKDGNKLPNEFTFNNVTMFSTHSYDKHKMGFNVNPGDENKDTKVYLQRFLDKGEGEKISSVLCKFNQEENLLMPEKIEQTNKLSEIPLSTSGFVNAKDCLSYDTSVASTREQESDNELIRNLAYAAISEKYEKINYFAVISGNTIRIIHLNGKDPFNVGTNFKPINIDYVGFNTAGRIREGAIRLKLECKLNYVGFIEFTLSTLQF